MKPLSVTVVQNSAGEDVDQNLERIMALLEDVVDTDLIALPEVFALRTSDAEYQRQGEIIPGPTTDFLRKLAHSRNAWVLGGSLVERSGEGCFNTAVLFDRDGTLSATYRKIHLFEAFLEDGQVISETDIFKHGSEPSLVDIEGWCCGLSICYDLRFPELYRHYAERGAHILFIPSNFTQRTGQDHWEVLIRTRAIENQCFVVAPDQCGANPATGITSYGHSMVVGPWGEVLSRAADRESVFQLTLNPALLESTRARIPVLKHRRL